MNKEGIRSRRLCLTYELGIIEYSHAVQIQQRLLNTVADHDFDVLLLLEHPPCLTIGRFKGSEDIIAPQEVLAREGIRIFHTDRGGGITYHGPGQLVGYPILNLKRNKLSIRQYISKLDEVIIKMLVDLGVYGGRIASHLGVWVGEEKICSIGLRIIRGVAMHGFALNVNPNLSHFEFIHPCGIVDMKMTSISKLVGYEVRIKDIKASLLQSFAQIFGFELAVGDRWTVADPNGKSVTQLG